jgi:hypothetical protein
MEFYLTPKKNKFFSFSVKWMELENIILSEGNQAQKAKSHMFSLICGIQTSYKYNIIMKHWSHWGEVIHRKSTVK